MKGVLEAVSPTTVTLCQDLELVRLLMEKWLEEEGDVE